MPLDRLDGFTFAHEYEAALENLDRGFTREMPLTPSKHDYGVSVAMTPIVVRDGVAKSHVVARMWVAMGLLAEDDDTQRKALHIIVQQLAHVACTQILDEALPGLLLSALEDPFDALLYPYADNAWSGYFGARASAVFDPSFGTGYGELAVAALSAARKDILQARLAYRFDGDIDGLLRVALPSIGALLRYTGQLLGHYDGLGRSAFEDASLARAFEEAGLRAWIELFQNDLSLVWHRRGQWNSVDEFLLLNRHVERLLWLFGLFPWKTTEGQIRIEVPLASDAAQLQGLQPALRLWSTRFARWLTRLVRGSWARKRDTAA